MIVPVIASRALLIAKNLVLSSKTAVRGATSTATTTVSRTRDKIRNTRSKIGAERKKQLGIKRRSDEDTTRAAKENATESTNKVKPIISLVGIVKKSLQSFWKLVQAWVILNLPKILEEIRKFTKKIRIIGASIKRAVILTGSVFSSIGKIAQALVKNILNFDFTDKSGEIRKAKEELETNVDGIGSSINEILSVWGREEDELDYMLTELESSQNIENIRKNVLSHFPEIGPRNPAFGPGSSSSSGGMIEMGADEQQLTESLIAGEEGVKTKAYKDSEGIWTIGYGQTRINGRPVKPGDTISKAQALSGFRGAVTEHQQRAISQLGENRWLKLEPRSRAVLSSIAYNYGSIPKRILVAAKTGSAEDIAVAMNSLYGDNGGDLRGRREREQSILRGDFQGSSANPTRLDSDFMSGGQFAGSGTGPLVMNDSPQPQPQSPQPANGNSGSMTNVLTAKDFNTTDRSVPSPIIKTSGFGMRGGRMHRGIDFAPPSGQRGWYCAYNGNGKVTHVGSLPGYGKTVIIQFGNVDLLFAHLASYSVGNGDRYTAGSPIGEVGNTGRSSGIHLHFEARAVGGIGGTGYNPEQYVNGLTFGKMPSNSQRATRTASNITSSKSEELGKIASMRTGGTQKINNTTILKQDHIVMVG